MSEATLKLSAMNIQDQYSAVVAELSEVLAVCQHIGIKTAPFYLRDVPLAVAKGLGFVFGHRSPCNNLDGTVTALETWVPEGADWVTAKLHLIIDPRDLVSWDKDGNRVEPAEVVAE